MVAAIQLSEVCFGKIGCSSDVLYILIEKMCEILHLHEENDDPQVTKNLNCWKYASKRYIKHCRKINGSFL